MSVTDSINTHKSVFNWQNAQTKHFVGRSQLETLAVLQRLATPDSAGLLERETSDLRNTSPVSMMVACFGVELCLRRYKHCTWSVYY